MSNNFLVGLLPWERATVPVEDMHTGLIKTESSYKAFGLCLLVFGLIYIVYPSITLSTPILIAVAILCARMVSIDLSHMVLPNIYVGLLAVVGLFHHATRIEVPVDGLLSLTVWQPYLYGAGIGFGLPFVTALVASLSGEKGMIGGGDIKLMAVAGLWLGSTLIIPYMLAVSLLSLLFTLFRKETQMMPMGPALCLAFWLFVLYVNEQTLLRFIQLFLEF